MPTAVASDETRIHYEDRGVGDALVLLHGISEDSLTWRSAAKQLADSHRVLSVDIRGHGRTTCDNGDYRPRALMGDLQCIAAHAGIEHPIVIGHSLGGLLATISALSLNSRGVISVDQDLRVELFRGFLTRRMASFRKNFAVEFGKLMQRLMGSVSLDLETELSDYHGRASQEVVLGIWSELVELDGDALARSIDEFVNSGGSYLSIHRPSVRGAYSAWLSAKARGAKLEFAQRESHWFHRTDEAIFLERVRDFIKAV